MNRVTAPDNFEITDNWHAIQFTTLHRGQPNISYEFNKMLKSFGRGSSFVVSGFNLGLFEATVNGKKSCIARITPGILVQDFTVIDFVQAAKENKKYIYVKVFDEDYKPLPGQVFKVGSRYKHGTMGDGIDARPSFSTIISLYETEDRANFKTLYSLSLNSNYGSGNKKIDIDNIDVEDFRFPPADRDPTDPTDNWSANITPVINYENNSEILRDDDYENIIARSRSIMWSLALR